MENIGTRRVVVRPEFGIKVDSYTSGVVACRYTERQNKMNITDLQKREQQIHVEQKSLEAELDFIYDQYATIKLEAGSQTSEAFPGQPKRSK